MKHKFTLISCVVSVSASAVAANLLPILFVPLMDLYSLAFWHLGLLVAVYFLAQMTAALAGARLPDKFGLRPLLIISSAIVALGFFLLYLSPVLFTGDILPGLILAAAVYGASVGFLEMMLSPVVNSLPFNNKHRAMSLFHSAFAGATVIAVAATSIAVYFIPAQSWNYIPLLWCLIPLACLVLWIKAPIIQPPTDVAAEGPKKLLKNKIFYLALAAALAGVACEMVISSGASAFIDKGLNVHKLLGDMMGPCMFALAVGLGRLLYGLFGEKLNVRSLMVWGSLACLLLYLSAALIPVAAVSVIALALCGFAVCLLLPGTFTTSSAKFPQSGVWLFAMLSAAGKAGGAGGSALFGALGGAFGAFATTQNALRLGLLCCAVFPLISLLLQIILKNGDNRKFVETSVAEGVK